jgi:hypothetical protein
LTTSADVARKSAEDLYTNTTRSSKQSNTLLYTALLPRIQRLDPAFFHGSFASMEIAISKHRSEAEGGFS